MEITLINNDKELKAIADELKFIASENPLLPEELANSIKKSDNAECVGPLVKISGKKIESILKRHTKVIVIDDCQMQVSYCEYLKDDERVLQLTIVDMSKNKLNIRNISRIGHFFINMNEAYNPVETPKHVMVLFNNYPKQSDDVKHSHDPDVKCDICDHGGTEEEAFVKIKELEEQFLESHGFYIHFVSDDPNCPNNINIHTHGLESFDHLDFQIVISLPKDVVKDVLFSLVERVKNGESFHDKQYVDEIITLGSVKLIEKEESGRRVLRIIFPDPEGNLNLNQMDEKYSVQYN